MTVVIVEPQTLIRDAIVALLEAAGFVAATDTGSGDDLVASVSLHAPDVVLLNVDPAPGVGISLFHHLPTLAERWRTVVLTVDDDPEMHASAIELGAMGIVTTNQP